MSWLADLERERQLLSLLLGERLQDDSPSSRATIPQLERRLQELEDEIESSIRPRIEVRLQGTAVEGHKIRVETVGRFLEEFQETVSSIGQALRGTATSSSSIPSDIREETAFFLESLKPGSVVLSLRSHPDPRALQPTIIPELETARETPLVVEATRRLFRLAKLARNDDEHDDAIVEDVFPLGARTYKHLDGLVRALVDGGVEVELSFLSPIEGETDVHLGVPTAKRIRDVLRRTRVAALTERIEGELRGVSSVRNAFELVTPDRGIITGRVREDLVPALRQWYEHRVNATVDITITRSLSTGVERHRYLLVGLDPGD